MFVILVLNVNHCEYPQPIFLLDEFTENIHFPQVHRPSPLSRHFFVRVLCTHRPSRGPLHYSIIIVPTVGPSMHVHWWWIHYRRLLHKYPIAVSTVQIRWRWDYCTSPLSLHSLYEPTVYIHCRVSTISSVEPHVALTTKYFFRRRVTPDTHVGVYEEDGS